MGRRRRAVYLDYKIESLKQTNKQQKKQQNTSENVWTAGKCDKMENKGNGTALNSAFNYTEKRGWC